ncbi:hypothetical protein DKX38_010966 [Salix brachista]|uniref:DUF8204 domain-containing protein n=1 Tax=Salix brachista TaxID=2182728 RepID=A0A5N5LXZ1_9ROSI|nr:hypothetical protein DKX38_010966 [Salix brachista]
MTETGKHKEEKEAALVIGIGMEGDKVAGEEKKRENEKLKPIQNQGGGGSNLIGKSCKGYLYYSSTLKSNVTNPRCIGIPRTLRQKGPNEAYMLNASIVVLCSILIPTLPLLFMLKTECCVFVIFGFWFGFTMVDSNCFSVLHHDILIVRNSYTAIANYVVFACSSSKMFEDFSIPNYVEQSEVGASKDGRVLTDFYYGCAGYSLYSIKDHSTDKQVSKKELPVCVGLELLVDRRVATADSASAPAHIHRKEVLLYMRNSGLVASGVARNMRRVGIYIKDSVDDMLFPYGRRPK